MGKSINIKNLIITSAEYAIAFSIVMTIVNGALSLLGVKDWGVRELALYFVMLAIGMAVVLNATVLLFVLFEKIRCKIRTWKIERRAKRIDLSEGETLDKHAEILGIQRAPEETDEDLRYRCIQKMILDEIQKEFQRK